MKTPSNGSMLEAGEHGSNVWFFSTDSFSKGGWQPQAAREIASYSRTITRGILGRWPANQAGLRWVHLVIP